MSTFDSLQAVADALRTAAEYERMALFVQGDVLLAACEPDSRAALGYATQEELLADLGAETGMSRRTVFNRMKVSRTFPHGTPERDYPLLWGVFLAAAGTDDPALWVARASDESLSASALTDTYRLETGKRVQERTVEKVLSTVNMRVVWFGGSLALMPVDGGALGVLRDGDRVQVSAWREVEQDDNDMQDDAQEAVV